MDVMSPIVAYLAKSVHELVGADEAWIDVPQAWFAHKVAHISYKVRNSVRNLLPAQGAFRRVRPGPLSF